MDYTSKMPEFAYFRVLFQMYPSVIPVREVCYNTSLAAFTLSPLIYVYTACRAQGNMGYRHIYFLNTLACRRFIHRILFKLQRRFRARRQVKALELDRVIQVKDLVRICAGY